ncbi:hypothetical protein C0J52_06619 [Blattella germanica]|nr:hypothetical protein C0J52_06619 [Blattella germanica]
MEGGVKDSQILVVVGTLLEAAGDKDPLVRESVTASLRRIAKKHPSFVLKNAAAYRSRNQKLSTVHLVAILQTMEQICKEQLPDIDGDVVLQLIEFGVEEMTHCTDYKPESQLPASGILVALGHAHCNEVMGGLLKQFQPGVVPHYTILHSMGTLAADNSFGIVPFVKATLALGKFSEAISDYLANIDQAPDPTVKKDVFSSEISVAYDILVHTWIHTREQKVCETVLQAVGPLFSLLPVEKSVEDVPRLIPALLNLYRRGVDPYPITQCLSTVLHVSLSQNKSSMEPLIDNLQNTMFDLVKRVLLKAIVAFAYRGYFDGNEGKDFVEFIVKHCCPQPVPNIHFLKLLLILNVHSAEEVSGPHVVLGRSLALLAVPFDSGRGTYLLQFLRNFSINISRHLKPLWEQKIPELISQLENLKDNWSTRLWEDLVLEFLAASLTEMDEQKWTVGLGMKMMEQTPLYQNYPDERGLLYKCLAVIVCHTTDSAFINHQLDAMLSCMKQHPTMGKACSQAVGICTRNHLELVLLKLEKLGKEELTRKSSRLLGFMKDVKHEGEIERLKLTLLLCYGEIALEAPGTHLLPQLEQGITQWVLQQLQTAKVICIKLPHFQLIHFCESLMDGLLDDEPSSSSGVTVVLNILLKSHGGEMYHQVNDILCNILERLANIQCIQTRNGSIRAILALAHHHPKAVVTGLLSQPLPYNASVCECWTILAQDPVLSADILEHFLQLLNNTPLYNEQSDRDKLKIVALSSLAAVSAMHEMFKNAAMQENAVKKFPELFSILLVILGCYIGTSPPINTPQNSKSKEKDKSTFIPNRNAYKLNPARVALDAFKSFLLCAKCDQVAEALLHSSYTDAGDNLTSFVDMIPFLTRALCSRMPNCLSRLVTCLNQHGTSRFESQRVVVVAVYAEKNRHYQPILSALIQGLDDHDSNSDIPLEAMRGFSHLLQIVNEDHVQSVQATVALRIKPFFENENPNVREAAFRMFGDLARCGGQNTSTAFEEQIKGNLVCLLLHLDDDNKAVVKACKYALRQAGPLLSAERLNTMLQDHLIDAGKLHYPDFMTDLVKKMVEEMPELLPTFILSTLVYIKSSWPAIRGNAAMFIGHLYGSLADSDVVNKVPMDTVCARLIQLLQDDNHGVRAKAAKALSYLVTV